MEKPVKKGISSLGIIFINLLFLILLLTIVLAVDTTPPIINSINASPNPLDAGNLLTITANVTDDILVKSVLVEINGTNYSMQHIAENDTLLSDGFESRNLSNWTTSGAGAAWRNSSASPFSGVIHIRAEPQNLGGSIIETNISTLGFRDIDFSFYAATTNLDAADNFNIDWNDGSAWINLVTTAGSGAGEFAGVTGYRFFGFSLPESANNKNNISIRFSCIAGGVGEVCDVDIVSVTKVPFGDLWSYVYNTTGLSGGLHNYTAYANDSSGNSAVPVRSNFTITAADTTLPIITGSLNKSINSILQNDAINATFNATDETGLNIGQILINDTGALRIFNFTLSGASSQFSQNFTVSCSAGCVVNVTGRANDTSGNFRQNETIFTVQAVAADTTPPIVNTTFNVTNPLVNSVINFSGNITDGVGLLSANITYNMSGALTKANYTISGTRASIHNITTITGCVETCVINFTMYATDTSNNVKQNSTLITVTDRTPPIVNTSLNKSLTNILENDIINLTANTTDGVELSFGQIIVNASPSGQALIRYFNFSLEGKTKAEFSQNITINCAAGCVINFTVKVNDTSNNFRTNDTVITVSSVDTAKPTVILDKPDNNYYNDTYLYANITFNGTAADNIELKNATLYHNASGIWKGNLSSILSGISAGFKFSLNLTNATFTWNVEACDAAGNCNFSTTNRTIILNFTGIANASNITNATAFSVLNFTPANNSLNVSLKQDITATFNQDANDSTLNNSTIIVKDSSNNAVRGKIKYFSSERKVRFNPHRFLKENETYTVNLTKDIKSDNGTSLDSYFIWKFTTEIKDTDKDGILDIDDNDDDNDGIDDSGDFLKGINASHIKTDIVGLTVKVNDSTNISKNFDKKELVQFLVNNSIIVEFNFSFGQSMVLDLTNISVQQNDNSSKGSIIINSLIVNATLKTFYLDNLSSYDGVCIKDADVDAISDMSNDCKSAFETFVACPGNAKNYDCSINGTRLKLTGLNHSGAQQSNDNAPPRIDLMSISYSGTSTVSATLTVITDEDANCKFDAVDVSFGNMGSSMSGSGTQHTGSRSYSTDTSGTYYVLCRDSFGNTMSSSNSISFNADVTESSGSETAGGGSGGGGGGSFLNFSICKEKWACDDWNECKNDFQTRKCFDLNNCGTKNQRPKEFQSCRKACEEIWQCSQWSICSDGVSKRECYDLSKCGTEDLKPSEYEECEFIAECYNLVQDQGEEGIDCGGACPVCETCFDRVQNQGEEGIDCGGPCRPCRAGDVLTGKNILVFSESLPRANLIFTFVIVVVLLFLAFKGVHTFKNVIKKSEEYRKDNKNEILSKLKDKYGINKMKPLTPETLENQRFSGSQKFEKFFRKPKKVYTFEIKKRNIEEIKAKPFKTTATGSSKDKILNVLKEAHQNGR